MALTAEMRVGMSRRRFGEVRIVVMVFSDCGRGNRRVVSQVLWPLG